MNLETYKQADTFERYPDLTAEAERRLRAEYASDPDRLRELLVLHNLRFAINRSLAYSEKSETDDDLMSRAVLGLVRAAQDFDPSSPYRFLSYAGYHIKLAYRDLFDKNLVATKMQARTFSVLDATVKNPKNGDGEDTVSNRLVSAGWDKASPDWKPVEPDAADRADVDAADVRRLTDLLLQRVFGMKNHRQREVVRLHLAGFSLTETGLRVGMSRERVRQIFFHFQCKVNLLLKEDTSPDLAYIREAHEASDKPRRLIAASLATADEIRKFVARNGIRVVRVSAAEKRRNRLSQEFDAAVAWDIERSDNLRSSKSYEVMRRVWSATEIERKTLVDAAACCGLTLAYARYFRSAAKDLVGRFRGEISEAEQDARLRRISRADRRKVVRCHFKPFFGGFYSEWSRYHRGESEIKMTPEDLRTQAFLGNIESEENRMDAIRARDFFLSDCRVPTPCSGADADIETDIEVDIETDDPECVDVSDAPPVTGC